MDEEGQPISKGKKKRAVVHSDKALQEAQDVFGVDFDFTEFEDYAGSEYEDEEDEEVTPILTLNSPVKYIGPTVICKMF